MEVGVGVDVGVREGVGVNAGDEDGVGDGVGVSNEVDEGVGVGDGEGDGVNKGVTEGVGVGVEDGVGVGAKIAVPRARYSESIIQVPVVIFTNILPVVSALKCTASVLPISIVVTSFDDEETAFQTAVNVPPLISFPLPLVLTT